MTTGRKRVLYVAAGGEGSTSMMKARALERLGHEVTVANVELCQPRSLWMKRVNNVSGFLLWQPQVRRFLRSHVAPGHYDVAWVDSGHMVGPGAVEWLRQRATRVVNYNHDDPTGRRDGRAWRSFLRSIPHYDLLVTVRPETEAELKARGARRVLRVWRSYDEVEHRPRSLSAADVACWSSEVVFVGTWMPERGEFFAALLARGVPLTIYGDFWPKAAEWPVLRPHCRGAAVYGADYAKVIQTSKIALGLLSKGNRDRHTTRTAEIPALGGLFCAERTDEHLALFREGHEAVFWRDAEECARQCHALLADEPLRRTIAANGARAVVERGLGHERILGGVLTTL